MKIKNIKKFVRSVLIIFGIVLILTLFICKSSFSYKETEYKTIYVSEGDTLWSIAKSNQKSNEYYKGKDIRYIINDLLEINHLENSNIKINQELLIPTI